MVQQDASMLAIMPSSEIYFISMNLYALREKLACCKRKLRESYKNA